MYRSIWSKRWALLALLGCTGGQVGCQFAPEASPWPKPFFAAKPTHQLPDRMMVIWSDTILHQPQQPGVRGFGGRIYFYKGSGSEPVMVDGGLAVYAFDAANGLRNSAKPERKFVFTADQFNDHMSHTDMGPSYSVWIPWDEVGGTSRQLSLVTRFEGRTGGVVISDPAVKLLPGLDVPLTQPVVTRAVSEAVAAAGGVVQASNQTDFAAESTASSGDWRGPRREVETLSLPPNFARHLRGNQQPIPSAIVPAVKPADANASLLGSETPNEPQSSSTLDGRAESASLPPQTRGYQPRHSFRQPEGATAASGAEGAAGRTGNQPAAANWMHQLPSTPRRKY
ncbi:hypothetical protein SH139x_001605 [Planctomycetaceae bacterium SH139]